MADGKKTQATPGPWRLTDDPVRRVIGGGPGKQDRTVCIIDHWTPDADAKLIAAAPEQQAKIDALADALEGLFRDVSALADRALLDKTRHIREQAEAALRAAGRLP